MRIASSGHTVFAVTMIVLGILGYGHPQYAGVWEPIAHQPAKHEVLNWLCAAISLSCGLGLLRCGSAVAASRLLLAWLLFWMLAFRVRAIFHAPTSQDSWSGWGETAVMVAAAWVLYSWFAAAWDQRHLGFATGANGLRIARVLFGVALIPFGTAHFAYIKETAALVPAWLPAHLFFAYFTGCAFLVAALAILTGIGAKLAATLTAVQLALFTLLVWLPIITHGARSAFVISETVISVALTAAAWVVAGSYYAPRPSGIQNPQHR